MKKRSRSIGYVIFYLLFWTETWRVAAGAVLAVLLGPRVVPPEMNRVAAAMVWIMLATIGYCASGYPAGKVAAFWQRLVLGPKARRPRR